MDTTIDCPFDLRIELALADDARGYPLRADSFSSGLEALVAETWARGVLAGRIEPDPRGVRVRAEPAFVREPVVSALAIEIEAPSGARFDARYGLPSWSRDSTRALSALADAGRVGADDRFLARLVAARATATHARATLDPIEIVDGTLADLGCMSLEPGEFEPDRPVLARARSVSEILELTERAGPREIGGAWLGRLVRLEHALAGTSTPIVTVLTAALADDPARGSAGRFEFTPDRLLQAAEVARISGRGESVLTVFHSHGWGCGECNQKECSVPRCDALSDDDYVVLDTLFPLKTVVLPIAGRRPGAIETRPVMVIHAWDGGSMRPIRWRAYRD